MLNTESIRRLLAGKYQEVLLGKRDFEYSGDTKMIELIGATFEADAPIIFGNVNHDYIDREIEWYKSQSLNVNDIPGEIPKIWKQVADKNGYVNSNYGWCIWSFENNNQYTHTLRSLIADKNTRRAEMIYTRPQMQLDYNKNGRSDFMCTDSVSYFIRGNTLVGHVKMRSNDVWAGYRNDVAWQQFVLNNLVNDLSIHYGHLDKQLIWTASSLHVYERQFYLLDHYNKTGEFSITKQRYGELYGTD
jgi:thymidylate synthase